MDEEGGGRVGGRGVFRGCCWGRAAVVCSRNTHEQLRLQHIAPPPPSRSVSTYSVTHNKGVCSHVRVPQPDLTSAPAAVWVWGSLLLCKLKHCHPGFIQPVEPRWEKLQPGALLLPERLCWPTPTPAGIPNCDGSRCLLTANWRIANWLLPCPDQTNTRATLSLGQDAGTASSCIPIFEEGLP